MRSVSGSERLLASFYAALHSSIYFFLCKGGPPLFSAFFFLAPLARLAVCSGPTARDSGWLVWFLRSSITQAIKFKIGCQVMRRLALLNAAYGKASKGYRSIAPFRWHDYRSYKRLWISATSLEQFSRHLFVWYTIFHRIKYSHALQTKLLQQPTIVLC